MKTFFPDPRGSVFSPVAGSREHKVNYYEFGAFPVRCSCGAVYRTEAEWRALAFVFVRTGPRGLAQNRDYEFQELRSCGCGACLTVSLAGKTTTNPEGV